MIEVGKLRAIINKELLLLSRDIHGLLLLFVMPIVFILIMSLAMQQDFASRAGVKIEVLVNDLASDEASRRLLELIAEKDVFTLVSDKALQSPDFLELIQNDRYALLLEVNPHLSDELNQHAENSLGDLLTITVAPATKRQNEMIFQSIVREVLSRLRLEYGLKKLQQSMPEDVLAKMDVLLNGSNGIGVVYSYQDKEGHLSDKQRQAPSSVQQSVPAWLVFSLFFVVVPLSNTLINERQLGTMNRLRTIDVRPWQLIAGKLVPYFVVNQLQVILMLLVGIYLVPWFGGDQLTLGESLPGLVCISVAVSCAALGYAILIAVLARTTEQATTLGGTSNIILAAIGGIMVPKFMMPEAMQQFSAVSPMSWGLEGFLDIFLRSGGVIEVFQEVMALLGFGFACLLLALVLFTYKTD